MTATKAQLNVVAGLARAFALGLAFAGATLALVFAAIAAAVAALMVLGAGLALRFGSRRRRADQTVLEARRTPTGWVVEAAPKG